MAQDNPVLDITQSVTCQTRRGTFLRGSALELSADRIRFETIDPFADVCVSDSVQELRVLMDGRVAYEGEGTIRNLFPIRGGYVCEVGMSTPWLDWVGASTGPEEAAERGLATWERFRRLEPSYVQAVVNLYTYLHTLQVSLEPEALQMRLAPEAEQKELGRARVRTAAPLVVEAIHRLYEQFEDAAQSIPPGREWEHRVFAQRLVHPYILQSPFVHRTFYKPLGYPGDYEMVDMMFRDPDEGMTLLGRLVNLYALQLPPILSHRSRIQYLFELLTTESLRVQAMGRPTRVFSMGAGPAREVQRYVRDFPRSSLAEFMLMDADSRTIEHLRQVFPAHGNQGFKRPLVQTQCKSILTFLKGVKRSPLQGDGGSYDVVYCAGLFDYLPDRLCTGALEAFYQIVSPGGVVVVTNVDENPSRHQMEIFLEWFVIPRNGKQMEQLLPDSIPREQVKLISDELAGSNLFMEVRKPS